MPLLSNITTDSFQLALWRIEEDLPFFEDKFTNHPDIKNENKRLQWYATRHLVNQLAGQPVLIAKDDAGKPLFSPLLVLFTPGPRSLIYRYRN